MHTPSRANPASDGSLVVSPFVAAPDVWDVREWVIFFYFYSNLQNKHVARSNLERPSRTWRRCAPRTYETQRRSPPVMARRARLPTTTSVLYAAHGRVRESEGVVRRTSRTEFSRRSRANGFSRPWHGDFFPPAISRQTMPRKYTPSTRVVHAPQYLHGRGMTVRRTTYGFLRFRVQ